MCMPIVIARSVQPRHSVIKLQVYFKCPLQISHFFSVTRSYVHVRWDEGEALSTLHIYVIKLYTGGHKDKLDTNINGLENLACFSDIND